MALQLQFDARQEYQIAAVESVARLFDGTARTEAAFALGEEIVANLPPGEELYEDLLLGNLNTVQQSNGIDEAVQLAVEDDLVLAGAGNESHRYPSFTIEMETGTGKTYVYLRTIYELRARYGFSRFIIVVPSIAIYEGVCKNFEITREHFRSLYGNEVVNLIRYDGGQLSRLRTFATESFGCQVMVMTLDSFNKISNNLYKPTEKLPGERKPYQFIQETRPILILDEPQNMGSEKSKQALRTLHPLLALRYSATHRESPNLVYRLTPFDAFRLSLVKKIEVSGVTQNYSFNQNPDAPFLTLDGVQTQGGLRATVRAFVQAGSTLKEEALVLRKGDDLAAKTKRAEYKDYVVEEIDATGFTPCVLFTNGVRLDGAASLAFARPEIFRTQIRETVERHFKQQERLRERGIKVLSLFFIDRVANYVAADGLVRRLFDEEFDRLKAHWPEWKDTRAQDVRSAYFAQKKAKSGEVIAVDTADADQKNQEEREAEKAAFQLIMRDKEKLLGFGEPVAFLFAHSALREGWDNPNVFQICTLNQTVSPMRKRQEIGRGLRLCVNQSGARVPGDDVNILTVVANESYQTYAERLQREYVEDGDAAPPGPSEAGRADARRNDNVFKDEAFRQFWRKLSRPVRSHYQIDTDVLVTECVNRLNRLHFPDPIITVERGRFVQNRVTLTLEDAKTDGRARVRYAVENTEDDADEIAKTVRVGDDLFRLTKDEKLRGFRVADIAGTGDGATLTFSNGVIVTPHSPYVVGGADTLRTTERVRIAPREHFPVPNLLERAARETGLTRPTINRIFQSMQDDQAARLLRNPENFTSLFISEVKNALADHIAQHIAFTPDGNDNTPSEEHLEGLFPPTKKFAQRELRPAGRPGLYDQVQTDSNVEVDFVDILRDDRQVVFYFKFPPAFKVALPRQIGNYNPDWGIARKTNEGITLDYVRETKGSERIEDLQWSHEKRKIRCAQKYFAALGLDYRPVTGSTADWYEPWSETAALT